eukprot:6615456-Lingulodinium_polyedra.AAC.1
MVGRGSGDGRAMAGRWSGDGRATAGRWSGNWAMVPVKHRFYVYSLSDDRRSPARVYDQGRRIPCCIGVPDPVALACCTPLHARAKRVR